MAHADLGMEVAFFCANCRQPLQSASDQSNHDEVFDVTPSFLSPRDSRQSTKAKNQLKNIHIFLMIIAVIVISWQTTHSSAHDFT